MTTSVGVGGRVGGGPLPAIGEAGMRDNAKPPSGKSVTSESGATAAVGVAAQEESLAL